MKRMILIVLLFAFSITTFSAMAQATTVSEEYKKELTEYYKLSGSDASISTAVDAMMQITQDIPQAKKVDFKKEVLEKLIRETIDLLAPVYERNISLADLKAMNKFYKSAAGKRISSAMPNIIKESMSSAMSGGSKIRKIFEETMKKHQQ